MALLYESKGSAAVAQAAAKQRLEQAADTPEVLSLSIYIHTYIYIYIYSAVRGCDTHSKHC